MTLAAPPPIKLPTTLLEWEQVLTNALLYAEDGHADTIRSFEITPERLAFFCGYGREHAFEAENAFRRALIADPHLIWCLQNGRYKQPSREIPQCLVYLALSLLVDSLLDGDYNGTNQYRGKLGQWLGLDRSFTILRGIAIMWEQLVQWLDTRVDEGGPFRRLVLPEIPIKWTHIGYTRYLSYPTRRDLRFLSKLIKRSPKLAADPAGLVRLLDPEMVSSSVSFGLKQAYSDFRMALRSGAASPDHRFWRLVEKAREEIGEPAWHSSILVMDFDEDGRRQYRLEGSSSTAISPIDIGAAAAAPMLFNSPNLGPGARRGILFFQSVGLASWTATAQPPSGFGVCHIAVDSRHMRLVKAIIPDWDASGTWIVTRAPISVKAASQILASLGISNAKECLTSTGLVDGVRVGNNWLGSPRFLPRLEGLNGPIDVRPLADNENVGLRVENHHLIANGSVSGRYIFSESEGTWSRRVEFVTCADVHSEFSGVAYALPIHSEWQSGEALIGRKAATLKVQWDSLAYEFQDVLEAIYASSRSGIGESDAIALIDRVLGHRSWAFLRMLVETTFLDERLRKHWKGRVFTLGQPRLDHSIIDGLEGVIVSGAIPARLEDDFKKTVRLQGGTPFRRSSGGMAPPILGALNVKALDLADALGWSAGVVSAPALRGSELNLIETAVMGDNYLVGSHWDWTLGRFRVGASSEGPIKLDRLVHPGGRDHDLYRVTGKRRRTFTSRNSAILEAHFQAGIPIFECFGGELRRRSSEGSLPIEIARALRARTISNAGLHQDGWSFRVDPNDEAWLDRLLPGLVARTSNIAPAIQFGTSRRGRGPRRALWIDGEISA